MLSKKKQKHINYKDRVLELLNDSYIVQPNNYDFTKDDAPLSMGFSRQEYRSELPCPLPGDLPDLGMEPGSAALQADSLPPEPPRKPIKCMRLPMF